MQNAFLKKHRCFLENISSTGETKVGVLCPVTSGAKLPEQLKNGGLILAGASGPVRLVVGNRTINSSFYLKILKKNVQL